MQMNNPVRNTNAIQNPNKFSKINNVELDLYGASATNNTLYEIKILDCCSLREKKCAWCEFMPDEQNKFEGLYDQVKCYMLFYKDTFLAHNFQDEQFESIAVDKMRNFKTCFDIAQYWEAVQSLSEGQA